LSFVADTGLHQQLRRVDRTERENDFTCGFRTNSLSSVLELDARGAAVIESNSRRQGTGKYGNVRLVYERGHIGATDRPSISITDRFIDARTSRRGLHHATIRVGKAMEPHRFGAFQQGEGEGVRFGRRLNMHDSARATVIRISGSGPCLNAAAIQIE